MKRVATMILDSYRMIGGVHPETASIKNIMAYYGTKAPHTGKPFSEAMLLGLGGGLGAVYMLWEFEKHGFPSLMVGFRYKWNYPIQFLDNLCGRLGATTRVYETAGIRKAAAQLEQVLSEGDPAIVWVDLGGKPYYQHYMLSGVVVVFGIDESKNLVMVDNRALKPFRISGDHLARARAKVPSYRNRIMVVESRNQFDLKKGLQDGIQDCIDYLGASSTSFALPSIRKWAGLMTNEKNKKGWPTVFKEKRGLFGTLRSLYEGIKHIGTGGGGMRGLYADFLEEAAPILNNEVLKTPASLYRALDARWQDLAEAALPDQIKAFQTTKRLIDHREAIIKENGSDGLQEVGPINDELHQLKAELNSTFPLNDADTTALYADIQSHLMGIYHAEKEALTALIQAMIGHP